MQFLDAVTLPNTKTTLHRTSLLSDELTTEVYLTRDSYSHSPWVVKLPKFGCRQTSQELKILPCLSHPAVVELRGAVRTAHGLAPVYPYAAGGDLSHFLQDSALDECVAKAAMFRLLDCVAYLHRNGVWHRDIKPENILVFATRPEPAALVLADFGMAARASDAGSDRFIASLPYMAPELLAGRQYTEKIDVWALGIVMYAALTGAVPFDTSSEMAMRYEILCGIPDLLEYEEIALVSNDGKDLLSRLLQPDSAGRPGAEEATRHRWFDDIRNIMDRQSASPDQRTLQWCM
jgi:protein serine kinase H